MGTDQAPKILQSAKVFFTEAVDGAMRECKVQAPESVSFYLVEMLDHYLVSENLHKNENGQSTLAEALLSAGHTSAKERATRLKRLGDTSLYISGFFGDSLKRKVVDIDYYAEIGGTAYGSLAASDPSGMGEVFSEFSSRFLEFVEVLTLISQKTLVQSNEDLLRLYDRYIVTGSKLAQEQLAEKGIIAPSDLKKAADQ